ncbi:MAG: lipocalin family protein [Capnocytophaga sp.]|nr:lipocalin family protein [Capnocytophaga sp.]
MKKIVLHFLATILLLFIACQKEAPKETENLTPPAPPTIKEPTPEEKLLGEWRLISIKDSNESLEREISNCKRQTSITFEKGNKASEISYFLDTELGECKHQKHQYSVYLQNDKLTLKEDQTEDTFTYQIKKNILTLSYPFQQKDGNTITVTTTYKKDYEYNPKKELIGTWYIHSLKRGGYNQNDILEGGHCMTKEKVVCTDTDIKIYQYDLGSVGCKEVVYSGSYEISKDLTKIIVTSKYDGRKGNRSFFLDNGTLELFGYISNGDLEQKFYKKEKKYDDE